MRMRMNNKAFLGVVLAAVSLSWNDVWSVNNQLVGVVQAQGVAAAVSAQAQAQAQAPVLVPAADREGGGRQLKKSKSKSKSSKSSKSTKTRRPRRTSRPTPAPTTAPTSPPAELVDIPNTADELGFTTLVTALTAADLVEPLSNPPNEGPFTVFAPTNQAFDLLGDTLLGCLLLPRYVEVLQNILLYHVANELVLAEDLSNGQVIDMLNGEGILIDIDSNTGTVTINDNSVIETANVMATNGVIHAIDRVLVPPGLNIAEFLETCSPTPSGLRVMTDLNMFGDSLSDTGNGNQYYPCTEIYCGQRFCNGPLMIELISDALGLGPVVAATKPDATNPSLPIPNLEVEGNTNWAFVSASTNTEEMKPGTDVKNDFDFQLDLYQGYLAAKQGTPTPSIEATTLQVVSFGGNDIREAADSPSTAIDFLQLSVQALVTNIQTLATMGACSFVVIGPPDVSFAPIVSAFLSPDEIEFIKGLSTVLSQTLEAALTQIIISNTDSKCFGLKFIDFFTTMNELKNSKEFQTEYPDPLATCNYRYVGLCSTCNDALDKIGLPLLTDTGGCNCPVPMTPEADIQLDCPEIPFYDELHGTAAVNEMFTQRFLADLDSRS